jgi:uncharacterized SAM-binding protein YcdF (DUF218 family)
MDCIIVLGHRIINNNLSRIGKSRLDKVITMYQQHTRYIILSGGFGVLGIDNILSEAKVMRDYLIKKKVNPKHIILEEKSIDTFTNALYCRPLIKKYSKVLVVTSKNHLFRARFAFKLIIGKNLEFIGV